MQLLIQDLACGLGFVDGRVFGGENVVLREGWVVEERCAGGFGVGEIEVQMHVCLVCWVGEIAVD